MSQSQATEKRLPGRPSNPTSERQQKLAERKVRLADGEIKKGRPAIEGSARQKRMAERAEKEAKGEKIQRGRPKFTPEQQAEANKQKEARKREAAEKEAAEIEQIRQSKQQPVTA